MKLDSDNFFSRLSEALGTENVLEIAEKIGIKKQSVYLWQKGGWPSFDTLSVILELSNVSLDWLLTGEGEKYLSKRIRHAEQMASAERGILANSGLAVSAPQLITLPVVATLANNQLLSNQKERTMLLPKQVCSESSVVVEVQSDDWQAEGLHAGDLLIVERPSDEDVNGKLVVAIHDGKAIIRRFEQRGELAHFSSLQSGPAFSMPMQSVTIAYLLTAIVHPEK